MHAKTVALAVLVASSASEGQPLQLARVAADKCMFNSALEILDDLPAKDRDTYDVKLFRIRLLVQAERGSEAITLLKGLAPSTDRSVEADRQLQWGFAAILVNDFSTAQVKFDAAASLGADRDIVDGALGMLSAAQGKLAESEARLRDVLKRDPRMSGALYNLACVRAAQGQVAEAAALVRQAWAMGLQNPFKLRTDKSLEVVRKTPALIGDLMLTNSGRCSTY